MRYTTDLTDTECSLISFCFPKPAATGRPRKRSYRELLDAILYLPRTGCQWRNPPKDLSTWPTVYDYFRQWERSERIADIHSHRCDHIRWLEGRQRQPTAGIADRQSVKSSETRGERGCVRRTSRSATECEQAPNHSNAPRSAMALRLGLRPQSRSGRRIKAGRIVKTKLRHSANYF